MAIDFEVIHFGDPSFDAAFLLNHLLLKSFLRPEWAPLLPGRGRVLGGFYSEPRLVGSGDDWALGSVAAGASGWQIAGRVHPG